MRTAFGEPAKSGRGSLGLTLSPVASWLREADGNSAVGRAIAFANSIKVEVADVTGTLVLPAFEMDLATSLSEFKKIDIQVPDVPVGEKYAIKVFVYNHAVSKDAAVVVGTAKNVSIQKDKSTPVKIVCLPVEPVQLEFTRGFTLASGAEKWFYADCEAGTNCTFSVVAPSSPPAFALFDSGGLNVKANTGDRLEYTPTSTSRYYLGFARPTSGGADAVTYTLKLLTEYLISYNLNGGAHTDNPDRYTAESTEITLNPANRTGYSFGGWYDNAGCTGTAITSIPTGSTGNKTLYAKWTPNTAAVTCILPEAGQVLTFSQTPAPLLLNGSQALSAAGLLATGGSNWSWLVDNELVASATGPSFTFDERWSAAPGVYSITVRVLYQGLWYSGEIDLTVKSELPPPPPSPSGQASPNLVLGSTTYEKTSEVWVIPLEPPLTITGSGTAGVFPTGRTVNLSPFIMGQYAVTQQLYTAVMSANPSYFHGSSGREPAVGETQTLRPVEKVSWYDAITFCNKLSLLRGLQPVYSVTVGGTPVDWTGSVTVPGVNNDDWNAAVCDLSKNGYRLPTEAEWEAAARGGIPAAPAWSYTYAGSNSNGVAWYSGNSGEKTHEVGKLAPNTLGIYDLSGNVREWCWDWYVTPVNTGAASNPLWAGDPGQTPSGTTRVRRGASWNGAASGGEVGNRLGIEPQQRYNYVGFRVVRSAR